MRIIWKRVAVFALSLPLFVWPLSMAAQDMQGAVRKSVERFCTFEFNGAQDPAQREELVHFSGARLLKKEMGGLSPYVFEWEVSPLNVIDSYSVGTILISHNSALATVTYQVIAARGSWGGKIEDTNSQIVDEQLKLIFDGQSWRVVNPPPPSVSKAFLSSSYRKMFGLPKTWYEHASTEQLLRLRNAIDTIIFLDALK